MTHIKYTTHIEHILQGFTFGTIQDALTVCKVLSSSGYSFNDLKNYVSNKIEDRENSARKIRADAYALRDAWREGAPECPVCRSPLMPPQHICKDKGPENLFGWTCLWYCDAEGCIYEKYTHETAIDEYKNVIERRQNNAETNTSQLAV